MQAELRRWEASSALSPCPSTTRMKIVLHLQDDEVEAFEVLLRLMYTPEVSEVESKNGRLLLRVFSLADRCETGLNE